MLENRDQIVEQLVSAGMPQSVADTFTDEQLQALQELSGGDETPTDPAEEFADMPREELIAALTEAGEDPTELEGMTDDELQAIYEAGQDAEGVVEQPAEEFEDAAMSRPELEAALIEAGMSPEELAGMSDEELEALLAQGGASSPQAPPGTGSPVVNSEPRHRPQQPQRRPGANNMPTPARRNPSQVTIKYSEFAEVQKNQRRILAQQRRIMIQNARQEAELVRGTIESFCENQVRAGRLLRAEVPATVQRLLRADHKKRSVEVFNEKGRKLRSTELEAQMREIEKRPIIVRFAERLPVNLSGDGADPEVQKIEKFCEQNRGRSGFDPERTIKAFKQRRARDPNYTAAMHTGDKSLDS